MMKRNNWLKWLNRNRREAGKASRPSAEQSRPASQAFVLESLEDRILLSATPVEAATTTTESAVSAAVVTTDKLDYSPGETAIITTSNTDGDGVKFADGEMVQFQVTRTDGVEDFPSGNLPWYVIDGVGGFEAYQDTIVDSNSDGVAESGDRNADGLADWIRPDNDMTVNGSISTTWFVEDQYLGSSLLLTATGQTSGAVATTEFTDALAKPTLNSATAISATRIDINWTNPTGGPDQIEIYRKLSTDSTFSLLTTVTAGSSGSSQTYNDNTVLPNTTYDYQARAKKTTGSGTEFSAYSSTKSATTPSATVATTTTVSSSLNASTYGDSVTFTATVERTSGTGTPSGSVNFTIQGIGTVAGAAGTTTATTAQWTYTTSALTAGSHTVSASFTGGSGFSDSSGSLSGGQTVNQKALTVTLVGTITKDYDGNTTATLASGNFSIDGVVLGESFTITEAVGAYDNKNVGTGKTVTATLTAIDYTEGSGTLLSNYTIDTSASGTTGSITAKAVALYGTREFDATAIADYTILDVTNKIGTDVVDVVSGQGTLSSLNVGVRTITNFGTLTLNNANYTLVQASGSVLITLEDDAVTRYIGETNFVTSGTSSTTAKVTLTASVTDPTGQGLVGAKVDFIDISNGGYRVLAAGVTVTPVEGQVSSGTANTVVTLSTGQYGAASYLILVKLSGNYDNSGQAVTEKTATVNVSQPAGTNQIKGSGTIANLVSDAGQSSADDSVSQTAQAVSYCVGLNYNKQMTNLQGKIQLTIPQLDGSIIVIQSNSLSSMNAVSFTDTYGSGKTSTVYAKASIYRINADLTTTAIDGNVTLRLDVKDYTSYNNGYNGTNTPDQIGFTALSTKDSTLYYSNDWSFDTTTKTWKTKTQAVTSGSCIKIG